MIDIDSIRRGAVVNNWLQIVELCDMAKRLQSELVSERATIQRMTAAAYDDAEKVDRLEEARASLPAADAVLTSDQRDAVRDAVAENMTCLYHCGRVWSAWGVGTMSEDDFSPADQDEDIIYAIVDAAIAAMPAAKPAAAAPDAQPDAWMTEDGRVVHASTMAGAKKDGGALLSSMRPFNIALYRPAAAQPEAKAAPAMGEELPQDERVEFETWMRKECGATDESLERSERGSYSWGRTCDMWAAWERACMALRQPGAVAEAYQRDHEKAVRAIEVAAEFTPELKGCMPITPASAISHLAYLLAHSKPDATAPVSQPAAPYDSVAQNLDAQLRAVIAQRDAANATIAQMRGDVFSGRQPAAQEQGEEK